MIASVRRCLPRLLLFLAALANLAPPVAGAADSGPGRLSLEFGFGVGHLSLGSNPYSAGGGGLYVDLEALVRLTPEWAAGVDVGALGLRPADSNYNPRNASSSIWGEAITNIFAVAKFEPQGDRGWFCGAGGGAVLYHNKLIEDATYNSSGRAGNGYGLVGRIGYDWARSDRWHFSALLGIETSQVRLNAPLGGNLRLTAAMAGVSVALH